MQRRTASLIALALFATTLAAGGCKSDEPTDMNDMTKSSQAVLDADDMIAEGENLKKQGMDKNMPDMVRQGELKVAEGEKMKADAQKMMADEKAKADKAGAEMKKEQEKKM